MDNIIYTSAAALMLGIFYSAVSHVHILFVSNTKLIIRQSDQIQFLLVRVIELDKKIKKIRQELDDFTDINDSPDTSVLDTIQEEEEEEELVEELKKDHNDNEENEENKDTKEASFEIVESTPIKTQKEKGWIRYLF